MGVEAKHSVPVLKDNVRLKPMQGYALAHGYHPSLIRMIHPSHAFFLSLCHGRMTAAEIAFLYGETYGLSSTKARSQVIRLIEQNRMFLTEDDLSIGEPGPDPQVKPRFEPKSFLYPGDDAIIASAAHGQWPVPAGINITLTFKCNFDCTYCYQDLRQKGDPRWDLTKCLKVVDEAADWGVVFLGLTGGEPTLFKGWLEVIEHGLRLGMIPTITSNGTVIGSDPRIAQRLAKAGMEEITISFDAPTAELHDAVTRSRGQFQRVLNAIHYLTDAGIKVIVKSVLTPKTQDGVETMIDLLVTLGVAEIGISYMETGAIHSGANSETNVTDEELARVRQKVAKKRDDYAALCRVHPPKDTSRKWSEDDWYPCGGINMGMSIFPTGDVSVCDKMHGVKDFTYGNVFEAGLKAIWNGDAFAALRERTVAPALIDPECAHCSKLYACRTSCFVDSFNATGSYYAKDPHCGGPFFT
ncbi:radical SAM protein with 4Fe4S-binding SPASM domain [Rhodopseudomonas julia]|uniref:Radical SAM protein with 4Fe4S-binding SPASM domain n=1 Tax=Rhodopseudomonas julia TaxID=200617 RepID=A0ABU0C356_9BRAD|nr:radical SAM protein [Rhodopseudomonas julia]MDQ0324945.1 radical SAM protein with 4Fe4S-binding SPASM domain [Rhodopseudomonas julia]